MALWTDDQGDRRLNGREKMKNSVFCQKVYVYLILWKKKERREGGLCKAKDQNFVFFKMPWKPVGPVSR
jgi:hypothetical protein